MKRKERSRLSSYILCMTLIVAMALFTTGCNDKADKETASGKEHAGTEVNAADANVQTEDNVLGEGSREFSLTVVDKEGGETHLEIHTDKETVGEALKELGVIAGEESEYGLYVKTVNGLTVDYDKDGAYWAFYINGEYAVTGVDATAITEGDSYSFKVESA